MKMWYLFSLFLAVFISSFGFALAQQQNEHPKGFYIDSLQRYYQQASLPVYVYVSTSPTQNPTQLLPDDGKEVKAVYLDGHGKHYLKHSDAMHQTEDKFAIYADGIAPVSAITFKNAPYYTTGGKNYYGKNLKISLKTNDEMSGINQLYFAVNQATFDKYSGEGSFGKEGDFNYRFYAVDNVGNVEKLQSNNFIVDLTAPKTYHNIVGIATGNIISTSTKIYLTPTDSIAGIAKTFYQLDSLPEKPYTKGEMIPFAFLADGDHTLTYYSIDNVNNKEIEKTFNFYLDKSTPIMSADILGDRFIVNDRIYFSGRTKLKLTAVDNKSGIKEVLYAIDNEAFKQYTDPFYLPGKSGLHTIRYYAIDNLNNEGTGNKFSNTKYDEYNHNVGQVYVDLTGPALKSQFIGPTFQKGDSTYISQATKISLSAMDPESGLQKITYSLDGENKENAYAEAFSINTPGVHQIEYYGYDNVNNRNVKDFNFVVDNHGPDIFFNFSSAPSEKSPEMDVYPSYCSLFLAATDVQTGNELIHYSINGGKDNIFTGLIKGFEKEKVYTIMVTATDKLGNVSKKELKFKTAKF